MRHAVIEFYKRFHKIEKINEDMQPDIDCMVSLLETSMKISIEKLESIHGPLRDDKAYRAVTYYLSNGLKDNFEK